MPGIDLIDLKDPLLRKRENNALRLITNEQDIFDDDHGFWYLWTAKEAVFKQFRELTNFDPKEIPIKIIKKDDKITFESNDIQGFYIITDDVIVAICHTPEEEIEFETMKCEDYHQSQKIRLKLQEYLSKKYDLNTEVVSDGDGLPIIKATRQAISFTHHYHHMGFVFDKSSLSKKPQSH